MITNKKRPGITLLDVVLGLLLAAMAWYVAFRMKNELNYKWNWEAVWPYLFRYDPETGHWVPNLLIQGFFTTIRLSFWATLLALPLGTIMGLCRTGNRLFNRLLGGAYVVIVRNLPPLVLILIFYFFISDQILPVIGIDEFVRSLSPGAQRMFYFLLAPPELLNAFLAGLIALALLEGAYITEIVRAGILSVDKGQWEAASALGMSGFARMRYVILPQAGRNILPPLAGQFISTIKDSAIVSVISIQDLTFQGMELMAATYLTFEIWITVTVLYLMLTLGCSLIVEQVEIRMHHRGGSSIPK